MPLLRLQATEGTCRDRRRIERGQRSHFENDLRAVEVNQGELSLYSELLSEIKARVRHAQQRAVLSANAEMILMYWDVGRMIASRQEREGWGAKVIPRLAVDLKNELPEEKGFSPSNLKRMVRFWSETPELSAIGARPVRQIAGDKLPELATDNLNTTLLLQLSWSHNIALMQMLFYHLQLRCFVVVDLKKGEFKPEYAGKMNFYCSVVDDQLRHPQDQPTLGLILCRPRIGSLPNTHCETSTSRLGWQTTN
ncbi:MAG: PDDEXK nuclease domain-containing protein [Pirellula sp.]